MKNDIILFQTEKNTDDVIKTVFTNIMKMLHSRNVLLIPDIENYIKNKLDEINDSELNIDIKNTDDTITIYAVKYVPYDITSINKSYGSFDFVENHKNHFIILVFKSINRKTIQKIHLVQDNVEIFLEKELMINLIDHELLPKNLVKLSPDEKNKVFDEYLCTGDQLPRMLNSDPLAKYYNLKPGDVCKITRYSKTAGFIPFYRIVIVGNIK